MDLTWLVEGALIFFTLLGIELVDRTNMLVISLSSKRRPRDVWIGASLAFVVSTAMAVAIGALFLDVLVRYLFYVRLGGGIFVIAYGLWGLVKHAEEEGDLPQDVPSRRTVLEAFLFVLLLEMGDDTQILTVLFVATTANLLLVFVAAALGLSTTAAIGARTGGFLRARFSPETLARASSVVIIALGIFLVLYAFFPL